MNSDSADQQEDLLSVSEGDTSAERPLKRFFYTLEDIATLTGLAPSTVYQYAQRGRFDPSSLTSVVGFCAARQSTRAEKTAQNKSVSDQQDEVEKLLGCGVIVQGLRPSGRLVFSLEQLQGAQYHTFRLVCEKRLITCGYRFQAWDMADPRNGYALTGWSRSDSD